VLIFPLLWLFVGLSFDEEILGEAAAKEEGGEKEK